MQKCPNIWGFAVEINQFQILAIAFWTKHGQKLGRNEAVRPNRVDDKWKRNAKTRSAI